VATLESYGISYASVYLPLRIGYKSDAHPIEMFDFYISGLKNKKACKGHPTSFIDTFLNLFQRFFCNWDCKLRLFYTIPRCFLTISQASFTFWNFSWAAF
jgi:hypothetical protein